MDYKKIFVVAILMIGFGQVQAQFPLPSFDVSLKAGYMELYDNLNIDGYNYSHVYQSGAWQGEVNLQLGQRVAFGWFYSRPLVSSYHEAKGSNAEMVNLKGDHLMYGANIRLSGGRASKLRPYVQMKYFWLEVAIEQSGYRTAVDLKGIAGGIGLMLRVNHKMYINLIEGEIGSPFKHDGIMFNGAQWDRAFPQLRTGLTYNFSKRK